MGRFLIRAKRGGRTLRALSHVEVNTETWLSGRKRLTANEVGDKTPRGFESHRLRQFSLSPETVGARVSLRDFSKKVRATVIISPPTHSTTLDKNCQYDTMQTGVREARQWTSGLRGPHNGAFSVRCTIFMKKGGVPCLWTLMAACIAVGPPIVRLNAVTGNRV